MNLYKINTTAYEEEDFFLVTDLTEQDIIEVVNPIVMAERDGYEDYDNITIFTALKVRYPKAKLFMFDEPTDVIV
jgi:hypothetical protein